MTFEFTGVLWYWRGPAPWYFVSVPASVAEQIAEVAGNLTYGWGMIPARVAVGATRWTTSLWPKDGGYIVPVKADVRRREQLVEDAEVTVRLTLTV